MTSLSTIGPEQQHTEGRTVRDIVEYSPDQVNEVWCRKIFRQVLQSLELQYAMRMPHRPITPDTIVFHDNGEPLLLPAPDASGEGSEAGDLNALARVLHYAITRELMPSGPLQGRAPGYSDSLVTAVDRCMAPDPAARPQSIEALRALLGIVPLGPPVAARAEQAVREIEARDAHATPAFAPAPEPAPPAAAAPTPAAAFLDDGARPHVPAPEPQAAPAVAPAFAAASEAAPVRLSHPSSTAPAADALPAFLQAAAAPRRRLVLNRWQRWAVAAGGGALLLALALVVFAEMREDASYDRIVLSLPQVEDRRAAPPAAAPADAMPQPTPQAPAPAAAGTPSTAAGTPSAGAAAVHPGHLADTPADGIAYKLQIQPWGVVYVDGVDRGVSPPVKRLVLAPGRYTLRIANPNFHDRVLEIDTANGGGDIAVNFNDEAH